LDEAFWIASSRSLSSGAHSHDPLAPRDDGPSPPSRLIAAHACATGATIVTANATEFKRVRGLKVDDWLA